MQSKTPPRRRTASGGRDGRLDIAVPGLPVTLTGADWKHLKPAILGVIMDHFMLGTPILRAPAATTPAYASPQADAETAIDPYAAENPAEFFAVTSEYFFSAPDLLHEAYPQVYAQLQLFYRQDPLGRLRQLQARDPVYQAHD